MRKSYRYAIVCMLAAFFSVAAYSQNIILSGTIKNAVSQENVPAASVTVKGTNQGTFTDDKGFFRLNVEKLPVTLVITSIGFETQEVTINNASESIAISFVPTSELGQEVVVSATRSPERLLEAPVTVERMSSATIRNLPAPNYYEGIANLKGVDMHTASLTFRTVTTRGFLSSGNTRLNQLIDGMDNQAPGLNFAVGSVIGLTELDVDNIELLAGASSALYGSGGVNGTLLINSKNPFRYQGLSFQVKQGINHISTSKNDPAAFYDWSVRYAKSFNDRFAFKISSQFTKAQDWEAYDYDNVSRTSVISKIKEGDRLTDPNYDGVNVYGDETTTNIMAVAQAVQGQTRQGILAATGGALDIVAAMNAALPANATPAQIAAFIGSLPAPLQPSVTNMIPFYFGLRNNIIPNQNVSRTGYEEKHLVDYNTLNWKVTGGLFYKITPNTEISWNSYLGTGTTVYTGADRYSLNNLQMAQHKLEIKNNNWFVRGYTTQENAGDSYQATALGRLINEAWKPSTTWYPQYTAVYVQARSQGASDYAAHQAARSFADQGRALPGTAQFDALAEQIKSRPIPNGALFLDKSDLWAGEAQINVSDLVDFTETVGMVAGFQYKQYVLNSQGTLFADTAGKLKPAEWGLYMQLKKEIFEKLTLTGAIRYDKHTNFDGRWTPRLTAVYEVAKDNFIRGSFQTAYRFPTNQDQYINLNTVSTFLIGLIPEFQDYYRANSTNPTYTAASVGAYRAGTIADSNRLQRASFDLSEPEIARSFELGYKGVVQKKLFFDAYVYLSEYKNFLERVAVVQSTNVGYGSGPQGTAYQADIYNPGTSRNLSYLQNSDDQVKTFGWGITANYQLSKGFFLYGNLFSDKVMDDDYKMIKSEDREDIEVATFFNTPDYRYNIGIRNENFYKGIGMNFVWKWQSENYYEGTFVTGMLPSFGSLDGQFSYKIPNSKSTFRIGGTNIINKFNRTAYGNPYVGGLYYVSFAYNVQ